MNEKERLTNIFRTAELSAQLVTLAHSATEDYNLHRRAAALHLATCFLTEDLSEEEMCDLAIEMYRTAKRGMQIQETQQ